MSVIVFLAPTEGTRARRPGDHLALSTRWELEHHPKTIEAQLVWYTESVGPKEVEVVSSKSLVRPGHPAELNGEKEVSFALPAGPFSYDGELFRVLWAVEMVIDGKPTAARFEFDLGPNGTPMIART